MAVYSRREFVEYLCGQEWNNSSKAKVAMWIKRGKVIQSGEKIDDSNPTNRDWALKQRDFAALDDRDMPDQKLDEPILKKNKQEIKLEIKQETKPDTDDPGDDTYYNLDKQYKKKQIDKMTVDTRIAELKEEKIRGEVVPMELVKNIFTTHTQSILTAQKDGIEQLLIDFTMEARLTGGQLAKLRGRMVEILNKGIDKSIIITQRNMKKLVDEFSITRGVGEHD